MTQHQLDDGITLLSGVMFNFNAPEACPSIELNDLARPLSNNCRFAGQLPYFYSIAQHCVNASRLAAPEHKFTALMHDTSEAFTNDIVTPLKVAVPLFKQIEIKIETDMSRRFEFEFPLPDAVKLVDSQLLALEMKYIRGQDPAEHAHLNGVEYEHLRHLVDLSSWLPDYAYSQFLNAFYRLQP